MGAACAALLTPQSSTHPRGRPRHRRPALCVVPRHRPHATPSLPAPRCVWCSVYATYEALEADFVAGALHPGDLKASLTTYIDSMLEPVRKHFASGEPAKLLEAVKRYRVTR